MCGICFVGGVWVVCVLYVVCGVFSVCGVCVEYVCVACSLCAVCVSCVCVVCVICVYGDACSQPGPHPLVPPTIWPLLAALTLRPALWEAGLLPS